MNGCGVGVLIGRIGAVEVNVEGKKEEGGIQGVRIE